MKEGKCRHDCNVHCIYKNYNRIDCFCCDGRAVDARWKISSVYQMGAGFACIDSNARPYITAFIIQAVNKATKERKEKNNEK